MFVGDRAELQGSPRGPLSWLCKVIPWSQEPHGKHANGENRRERGGGGAEGHHCVPTTALGGMSCLKLTVGLGAGRSVVANFNYPKGRGVKGQKHVYAPKSTFNFGLFLINFIFFLRKMFLMWVGGWSGVEKLGCHSAPPLPMGTGEPWLGWECWDSGAGCQVSLGRLVVHSAGHFAMGS